MKLDNSVKKKVIWNTNTFSGMFHMILGWKIELSLSWCYNYFLGSKHICNDTSVLSCSLSDEANGIEDCSAKMTSSSTVSRAQRRKNVTHQSSTDLDNSIDGGTVTQRVSEVADSAPTQTGANNSKQFNYHHPARRKEKINDWRDVKSKMRRRLFQV